MRFKFFTPFLSMSFSEMTEVGRFLERNLDGYKDSYDNIIKAIQSSIKQRPSFGGFVITAYHNQELIGAIVINNTGMDGYAPQNLIVYFAVHKDHRRKGIGQQLLQQAVELAKGDIALHLKPEQKASSLFDKIGFETSTITLQLSRSDQENNPAPEELSSKSQYHLQKSH